MLMLLVLTVSGMGFLQLHYLEQRMAMGTRWNENSFFLASAGIERAREVFKVDNTLKWTNILNGTTANFPTDANPDALLCPDTSRGCTVPSFQAPSGNAMTSQNALNFPFFSSSDIGSYSVRAFNDEPGTTDTNGIITVRSLGDVLGEKKMIEAKIQAATNLDLINCKNGLSTNCPDPTGSAWTHSNLPGFDPAFHSALPSLIDELTVGTGYYRSAVISDLGIPAANVHDFTMANLTLDSGNTAPHSYYFNTGNIAISNDANLTNVSVVVALGDITVNGATLSKVILASGGTVSLKNNTTVNTQANNLVPYPAIIAGVGVTNANNSVSVYGNIFSSGTIDMHPVMVTGSMIGNIVKVQGAGSFSDGSPTSPNRAFYDLMPGFTYPSELKTTRIVSSSWKEIQ